MVGKKLEEFAKAVKEKDSKRVDKLIDEILREKSGDESKLEAVPGLGEELVKKIQMHGFNTIEKVANSSLKELAKIPELKEGKAKKVLESAREYLAKNLTELPGVGENTAKEMLKHGYATLHDIESAPVEDLSEVPGIGKKGARKIKKYSEKNSGTSLENLPGVGKKSAEAMRESGFTEMQCVAESSVEELMEVPNVGRKGAEEILEYAKENPKDDLKDLPGVGDETAEEIKKHGFTVIRRVSNSSVEELTKVPNIGKEGAKKIREYAREKLGGRIEELSGLNGETIEELKKRGFSHIGDIAKSSVEELIEIPGLEQGRAKNVLEAVREEWGESGEIEGYRRALEGHSTAMESENHLSLAQKIADGEYSQEKLKKMKEEKDSKAKQEFRSARERGFNEAWRDVLEALISIES